MEKEILSAIQKSIDEPFYQKDPLFSDITDFDTIQKSIDEPFDPKFLNFFSLDDIQHFAFSNEVQIVIKDALNLIKKSAKSFFNVLKFFQENSENYELEIRKYYLAAIMEIVLNTKCPDIFCDDILEIIFNESYLPSNPTDGIYPFHYIQNINKCIYSLFTGANENQKSKIIFKIYSFCKNNRALYNFIPFIIELIKTNQIKNYETILNAIFTQACHDVLFFNIISYYIQSDPSQNCISQTFLFILPQIYDSHTDLKEKNVILEWINYGIKQNDILKQNDIRDIFSQYDKLINDIISKTLHEDEIIMVINSLKSITDKLQYDYLEQNGQLVHIALRGLSKLSIFSYETYRNFLQLLLEISKHFNLFKNVIYSDVFQNISVVKFQVDEELVNYVWELSIPPNTNFIINWQGIKIIMSLIESVSDELELKVAEKLNKITKNPYYIAELARINFSKFVIERLPEIHSNEKLFQAYSDALFNVASKVFQLPEIYSLFDLIKLKNFKMSKNIFEKFCEFLDSSLNKFRPASFFRMTPNNKFECSNIDFNLNYQISFSFCYYEDCQLNLFRMNYKEWLFSKLATIFLGDKIMQTLFYIKDNFLNISNTYSSEEEKNINTYIKFNKGEWYFIEIRHLHNEKKSYFVIRVNQKESKLIENFDIPSTSFEFSVGGNNYIDVSMILIIDLEKENTEFDNDIKPEMLLNPNQKFFCINTSSVQQGKTVNRSSNSISFDGDIFNFITPLFQAIKSSGFIRKFISLLYLIAEIEDIIAQQYITIFLSIFYKAKIKTLQSFELLSIFFQEINPNYITDDSIALLFKIYSQFKSNEVKNQFSNLILLNFYFISKLSLHLQTIFLNHLEEINNILDTGFDFLLFQICDVYNEETELSNGIWNFITKFFNPVNQNDIESLLSVLYKNENDYKTIKCLQILRDPSYTTKIYEKMSEMKAYPFPCLASSKNPEIHTLIIQIFTIFFESISLSTDLEDNTIQIIYKSGNLLPYQAEIVLNEILKTIFNDKTNEFIFPLFPFFVHYATLFILQKNVFDKISLEDIGENEMNFFSLSSSVSQEILVKAERIFDNFYNLMSKNPQSLFQITDLRMWEFWIFRFMILSKKNFETIVNLFYFNIENKLEKKLFLLRDFIIFYESQIKAEINKREQIYILYHDTIFQLVDKAKNDWIKISILFPVAFDLITFDFSTKIIKNSILSKPFDQKGVFSCMINVKDEKELIKILVISFFNNISNIYDSNDNKNITLFDNSSTNIINTIYFLILKYRIKENLFLEKYNVNPKQFMFNLRLQSVLFLQQNGFMENEYTEKGYSFNLLIKKNKSDIDFNFFGSLHHLLINSNFDKKIQNIQENLNVQINNSEKLAINHKIAPQGQQKFKNEKRRLSKMYASFLSQINYLNHSDTQNLKYKLTSQVSISGYHVLLGINKDFDNHDDASLNRDNKKSIETIEPKKKDKSSLKKVTDIDGTIIYQCSPIFYRTVSFNDEGKIQLFEERLSFIGSKKIVQIEIKDILFIFHRTHCTKDVGCEIYTKNNRSYFFIFPNNERENFYEAVDKQYKCIYSTIDFLDDTLKYDFFGSLRASNRAIYQRQSSVNLYNSLKLNEKWSDRIISNYQYIYYLNLLSDRSFQFIDQYPIFPLIVLCNQKTFNLDDYNSFRDLSLPTTLLYTKTKPKESAYGTTSPLTSISIHRILIRTEPYTTLEVQYQGSESRNFHKFDEPSRLFQNLNNEVDKYFKSDDVNGKCEMPPEVYTFPFYLVNENGFNLGKNTNSENVNDVLLPSWSKNIFEYTSILRIALESEIVSKNIHQWLDMFFGPKRNIDPTDHDSDVFSPSLLPEQMDENSRIDLCGRFTNKLFNEPHIKRKDFTPLDVNFANPVKRLNTAAYKIVKGLIQLRDEKTVVDFRLNEKQFFPEYQVKENSELVCVSNSLNLAMFLSKYDTFLTILNLNNGSFSFQCQGYSYIVCAETIGGRYILTGGHDCTIRVWDINDNFSLVSYSNMHNDTIQSIGGNRDIGLIVSSDKHRKVIFETLYSHKFIAAVDLNNIIEQYNNGKQIRENDKLIIRVMKSGIVVFGIQHILIFLDQRGRYIAHKMYQEDDTIISIQKYYDFDRRELLFVGFNNYVSGIDLTTFSEFATFGESDKLPKCFYPIKNSRKLLVTEQYDIFYFPFDNLLQTIFDGKTITPQKINRGSL